MKISDLVEDLRTHVAHRDTRRILGQGREALTYSKGDDADRVYKVSSSVSGNSIFLHALAQTPSMQRNPYFPKVHATKTAGGDRVTIVERLLPVSSVTEWEEVQQIFSVVYGPEVGQSMQPNANVPNLKTQVRAAFEALAENIFWFFTWNESMRPRLTFTDPQLVSAGEALRHICEKASTFDIHVKVDHGNIDNLMIRRTGDKIQLVVSDPLTTK